MHRSSWLAGLIGVALATAGLAAGPPAGGAPAWQARVVPGQLVRWEGPGSERCGRGEESWDPLAGACWYPFDLDAPAGVVKVFRLRQGQREEAAVTVGDYAYPTQRITLKDDSQVNLSPRDLARAERESAAVAKLWSRRSPARFTLPLGPPLAKLPEGGRFGSRRIFNGEPRSPHSGVDFAAATGTPVLAVADGTVVLAADHFFSGNSVFIDHGDGLISMYFHLSRLAVRAGQQVHRGERLGAVGATGRATGPHLHFGVRWRGARVDPEILLGTSGAVAEVQTAP